MKNQYTIYVLWLEYFSFKRCFNIIIRLISYLSFFRMILCICSSFEIAILFILLFAGTENWLVKQVCILILDVTDFLSGYKSDTIIICLQGRHSGIFNIFQLKRSLFKCYIFKRKLIRNKNRYKKKRCECLFWEELYTDDSQEIYFMGCNKVYLEVGNVR